MKHNYLILFLLMFFWNTFYLSAETEVSENITSDVTWTLSNSPYLITKSITITETGNLTIEAGVVVKFQTQGDPNNNILVTVNGKIRALGTTQSGRVVFTSSKDDVFGGDTNLDGLANIPDFGDWLGFEINSNFSEECVFEHCLFRYGGFLPNKYGAIRIIDGSPKISNGYFYRCAKDIVVRGISSPKIEYNLFEKTGWAPISMTINSDPVFKNNTFKKVGLNMLGLETGAYFLAGTHVLPKRNLAGTENIAYFIQRDITIEEGMTLDIDPGVCLKFNVPPTIEDNPRLIIKGTLDATGTENDPIFFTSERDDAIIGDSNNDGNSNPPGPGDWYGVQIESSGSASRFNHCNFRYGGYHPDGYGALRILASTPMVENSLFLLNSKGIVVRDGGQPTIKGNTFDRNAWVPISIDLFSKPIFGQNSFEDNSVNAVGLEPGNYTSIDPLVLDKIAVAGLDNMPYFIQDDLIIDPETHLEIKPGVIIKFNIVGGSDPHIGIKVNGSLEASGLKNDPIVFTSERDDEYGGDTNNDGNNNLPAIGDWWGIQFEEGSSFSLVDHCIFRYGGYTKDDFGAVCTFSNNVEIRNSKFYKNSKGVVAKGTSMPRIINNIFEESGWVPISKSFAANPYFENNQFQNNAINALGLEGGEYLEEASYRIEKPDGQDAGGSVYFVHEDILLGPDVYLTIDPGVILKFDIAPSLTENRSLRVQGTLIAKGTESEPITFTSERDDAVGGDTNNDGDTNPASFGDWMGLEINSPAANNSVIENCVFKYGGYRKNEGTDKVDYGILRVVNANPKIHKNLFKYNYKHLVALNNAKPEVYKNNFESSAKVAVSKSLDSNPSFLSNSFLHNAINALGIEGGDYSSSLIYRLEHTKFNGNENIPYYIDGRLDIGTNSTLILAPGLIFRFAKHQANQETAKIVVNGNIIALGTEEERIVFTSELDAEMGGVIHRDDQPLPELGEWSGIEINGGGHTQIENCLFRFGGFDPTGDFGALLINGSNPAVKNCKFEFNEKALNVYGDGVFGAFDCEYNDNNVGISVSEGTLEIGRNEFVGNHDFDIENLGADDVFAEENNWDFLHFVQIMTEGDQTDLNNIFDVNDSQSSGQVHIYTKEEPDHFIHEVYPTEVDEGTPAVDLTVLGFRFQIGTRVILRKEWVQDIVAWAVEDHGRNSYELKVNMDISTAPAGFYDVVVINPDGEVLEIKEGFKINGFEPELDQLDEFLVQNFPNPFYEETEIRFAVPEAGPVKVEIINDTGWTKVLVEDYLETGRHSVHWRGTEELPGGIYYCRLIMGNHSEVKKILYLK